jgi:hypothetical protein
LKKLRVENLRIGIKESENGNDDLGKEKGIRIDNLER